MIRANVSINNQELKIFNQEKNNNYLNSRIKIINNYRQIQISKKL